jgi:hypothetical protein
MWFERFVIIVTSLHRDYIPSSWTYFRPSIWDISLFIGTFGLFLTMFLLFCKFLPVIAVGEVKAITPAADPHPAHGDDHHDDHQDEAHHEEEHAEAPAAAEEASSRDDDEDEPPPKPKDEKPTKKGDKKKGKKKEDRS